MISDDLPRPVGSERGAHWLRAGVIAWDLPDDAGDLTYRLHWAPAGGLTAEDGAIVGGSSLPLALDAAGLPAGVREQYPHLASYDALRLPRAARRRARELLTGQLVVAAYDADGRLGRATGVQIPGVLDDLYADAADARLGP
ncbi:MAG: pullulanase-type alpha-1,6-glucosidase, partial [Solirubrobacteraceae bacterium]